MNVLLKLTGGLRHSGRPRPAPRQLGLKRPTGIADLRSPLAVSSEVPTAPRSTWRRLSSSLAVTRIKARLMRQDNFHFEPTHKLLLAVNDRPAIDERDDGTWRRLRPIPLPKSFPIGKRPRPVRQAGGGTSRHPRLRRPGLSRVAGRPGP